MGGCEYGKHYRRRLYAYSIPAPRAFTAGEEASTPPPDPGHRPSQHTLVLALEPVAEEIRAASRDRRRNAVSVVVFVKLRSASRRHSPTAGENPRAPCGPALSCAHAAARPHRQIPIPPPCACLSRPNPASCSAAGHQAELAVLPSRHTRPCCVDSAKQSRSNPLAHPSAASYLWPSATAVVRAMDRPLATCSPHQAEPAVPQLRPHSPGSQQSFPRGPEQQTTRHGKCGREIRSGS